MAPSFMPLVSIFTSFFSIIGSIYTIVILRKSKFVRKIYCNVFTFVLVFDILMNYGITISICRELWLEDIAKKAVFIDQIFEIQLNVCSVLYLNLIILIDIYLYMCTTAFDRIYSARKQGRIRLFRILFLITMNILLVPYYLQTFRSVNYKQYFLHDYALQIAAAGGSLFVAADSTIHICVLRRIRRLDSSATYNRMRMFLTISMLCPWVGVGAKIYIAVHPKIILMDYMSLEQMIYVLCSVHGSLSVLVYVMLKEIEMCDSVDMELEVTRGKHLGGRNNVNRPIIIRSMSSQK